MQGLQRRVLIQRSDVVFHIFRSRGTNDRARIHQVSRSWSNSLLRNSPRINILAGLQRINGQKRFAFVLERGRDWSLEESIERQQILRRGFGTRALIEFDEFPIRRECLRVTLFLVKLLKYLSGLDQLGHGLTLAVSQL